ncbi:hypothetical protein [Anaerovorax odorimutans]|uniref:hypothetical protein n=1 Tax=Anaerovorax odorimutans TaxID=109327 RepID=UPI0003F9982B|nr:hypothetical protein [Anaerovorax odorimutans]
MSLCLIKYLDNGNLMISGDSRACTYDENGVEYISNDTTEKICKIDDKTVAFVSGMAYLVMKTIDDFKDVLDKSPDNLAKILKRNIESIPESEIEESRKKLMTAIILATVENDEVIYYVVTDACEYKPIRLNEKSGGRAIVGAYDESLMHFYYNNIAKCETTEDAITVFNNIYQKANSYQVGGIATIYELSSKEVISEFKYQIKDKQTYRRLSEKYREVCNLKGLNIINDRTGETTLSIDNGGSVNMNSGNINWNNVNSDPKTTDAVNDIDALARGEYTKAGKTFINGNYIYSPNIQAGKFYGAEYLDSDGIAKLTLSADNHYSDLLYRNIRDNYDLFKIRDGADGTITLLLGDVPVLRANLVTGKAYIDDGVEVTAKFK